MSLIYFHYLLIKLYIITVVLDCKLICILLNMNHFSITIVLCNSFLLTSTMGCRGMNETGLQAPSFHHPWDFFQFLGKGSSYI